YDPRVPGERRDRRPGRRGGAHGRDVRAVRELLSRMGLHGDSGRAARETRPVARDSERTALRRAAGRSGSHAARRGSAAGGRERRGSPAHTCRPRRCEIEAELPRMTDALGAFLEATVRTATPLALAALGETVSERA